MLVLHSNAWGGRCEHSSQAAAACLGVDAGGLDEIAAGAAIDDFRLDNVRDRIARIGDLWKPLLAAKGRIELGKFLTTTRRATRRRA